MLIDAPMGIAATPANYTSGMSTDILHTMGLRIKALMAYSNVTGKELAREIGVSEVFVSNMVNGKKHPSIVTLVDLARALHTTTDYLSTCWHRLTCPTSRTTPHMLMQCSHASTNTPPT